MTVEVTWLSPETVGQRLDVLDRGRSTSAHVRPTKLRGGDVPSIVLTGAGLGATPTGRILTVKEHNETGGLGALTGIAECAHEMLTA